MQAVWERSSWLVQAADADEARDKFQNSAPGVELEWCQVEDAVEGVDSEIESVEATE